ncbi:unnamed protein product [Cyprideis torosa]|uniref:Uncharacterized protein n=1 Tax=Cyprideis torosa TaxID=163714 RepID=A0A7R8WLL8_9CRUS|nr:unnamed protein product [Cyprideis torosa]CAG0898224.1 unnamed protein product [Cyprideis torosa]
MAGGGSDLPGPPPSGHPCFSHVAPITIMTLQHSPPSWRLRRRGLAHEFRSQIVFARVPYLKTPQWMHLDGFIYIIGATVFFAREKWETIERDCRFSGLGRYKKNIIPIHCLKKGFPEARGKYSNVKLKGFSGENFPMLGFTELWMKHDGKEERIEFVVTKKGSTTLFGRDLIQKFNLLEAMKRTSSAKTETIPYALRDKVTVGIERLGGDTSLLEFEPQDVDADEVARFEAKLAQVDSLWKELRIAHQEV